MAEDVTNPFAAIMGALTSKSAPKSGRSVRKDNRPGEVNPNLTSQEISRYTKIFGIMKGVIDPDPEAQKISGTAAAGGDTASQMAAIQAGGNGGNGAGGGNLMSLLGAGLLGTALAIVTDTGHLATMALKLAKLIPIKMLKVLPLVGSLINFGYAYDAFQRNKPIDGIWELTSGIAGLFPGIGTAVSVGMDMIKFMYESNNPKDENGDRDIDFGTWLKEKGRALGEKIWTSIVDGKVPLLSGLYQFGVGIGHMATLDFAKGFKAWGKILPAFLGQGDNEEFLMAFDAFTTLAGEELNPAYQKGREIATDSWGWLTNVFDEIGNTLFKVFEGAQDIFDEAIRLGKNDLIRRANKIPGINMDLIPKPLTREERRSADENAQKMMDRAAQVKRDREKYLSGELFQEEQEAAIKKMLDAEEAKKFGTNIQDGYISKNGNVTAFDDEDSILAAKTGGPIDKMLDGNSKTMSTISDINKNQLSVLISIRNGINALVSQSGKTGPTDIQFSSNKLTTEFYA